MSDLERGTTKEKIEQQQPTEKSPLLKTKEGIRGIKDGAVKQVDNLKQQALDIKENAGPASWSFWWQKQASAKFKVASLFALQTSVWMMLMVGPALAFPMGRKVLRENGLNLAYIVCNFLFNMGLNFGATMRNIVGGAIGVTYACVLIWILNGVFPAGYTGESSSNDAWFAGILVGLTYSACFLCLNVDGSVRFWALYTFVPFLMAFLNPGSNSGFALEFQFEWTGSAWNTLGLYIIGCVPSIFACLIPMRVSAMDALKTSISEIMLLNFEVQERMVTYYARDTPSLEVKDMRGDLHHINGKIAQARKDHDDAYWECFNMGSTGTALRMMEEMLNTMALTCWNMESALGVVKRETFSADHNKIMQTMKSPILEVVNSTKDLAMKMKDATMDGTISEEEAQQVHDSAKATVSNVNKLRDTFAQFETTPSRNSTDADSIGEHVFIYAMGRIAKIIATRAKEFCEKKEKEKQRQALNDFLCYLKGPFVNNDKAGVRWGLRNLLSVVLSCYIGYIGWSPECLAVQKTDPDVSCMIHPYNPNPSCLIILIMSKANIGAELQGGLDKILAVVLAMVCGQMAWTFFAWCIAIYRLWTGLFCFFFVFMFLYVAFASSGSLASLGTRLAAMGAMDVLMECSRDYLHHKAYSEKYHKISDYCIGLTIMLVIDFTFGGGSSSKKARESMLAALKQFEEFFVHYFQLREEKEIGSSQFHDVPNIYDQKDQEIAKKHLQCIVDQVQSAMNEGESATLEPLFWHEPWRQDIFTDIGLLVLRPALYLRSICQVVGNDEEAVCMAKLLSGGSTKNVSSLSGGSTKTQASFKKMTEHMYVVLSFSKDLAEGLLRLDERGETTTPLQKWQACISREPFDRALPDKKEVMEYLDASMLQMDPLKTEPVSAELKQLEEWLDAKVPNSLRMRSFVIVETLESMLLHVLDTMDIIVEEKGGLR